MHVILPKERLLEPLALAATVVPKKTSRLILTHLLLTAAKGEESGRDTLEIRATDEETSYTISLEASVLEAGSVAIAARDLYEIVRNLKSADIELRKDPEKQEIAIQQGSGKIRFDLNTLDPIDFPEAETRAEKGWVALEPSILMRHIETCSYAVSTDEARYYLGGVYVQQLEDENVIRLVATDGHRLAVSEIPDAPTLPTQNKIIPAQLIAALRKFVAGRSKVEMHLSEKRIAFRSEGSTLEGLLVEGSYPDYRQVIPKKNTFEISVSRAALIDAIRRIVLLSPEKTGGMRFSIQDGLLTISSHHTGRGHAKEEIPVEQHGGEAEMEIGFNGMYFVEAASKMECARLNLGFTNYLSPCLVRTYSEAKEGEDPAVLPMPLAVIMPMRL